MWNKTLTGIILAAAVLAALTSSAHAEDLKKFYFECGKQWVTVTSDEDQSWYNVTFWKLTKKTPSFGVGEGNMGFMNGKRCRSAEENEFYCATAETRFAARAFCNKE
jgi:hypothetical protein